MSPPWGRGPSEAPAPFLTALPSWRGEKKGREKEKEGVPRNRALGSLRSKDPHTVL